MILNFRINYMKPFSDWSIYLIVITKIKTNMQIRGTKRNAAIHAVNFWWKTSIERLIEEMRV